MLKYLAKISMDIFPSVLATIIGAYIVNHYINARPAPDTAAAVATAQPKKNGKPAGATDVANLPAPGVKAKGIAEKAVSSKSVEVKPAEAKSTEAKSTEVKSTEAKSSEFKPTEAKAADPKPTEEAAAPANPRAHQPALREKAIAKAAPAMSVEANAAPAGNAAAATPDANDLVRAAIERLRKTPETPAQESARAAEAPHLQEAPRIVTATPAAARPLPPPITVSAPASETYAATQQPASPPYTASVGGDDANRPTPPADIPVPIVSAPPPLDLRADAAGPLPRARSNVTNVADDMLSAAKSMFHAVIPKAVTPD